jgi:superfamily II DNA or RNA helicase
MTREEIDSLLQSINSKELVLELSTGYGKTRYALEYINKYSPNNILIVVPRLILINNWKDEITKWGYNDLLNKITFSTYVSLHKHSDKNWDFICYDEAHHLSDKCKEIDLLMSTKFRLFLSATLKKDLVWWIRSYYPSVKFISVSLKDAIENEVLPDPKILLIPLTLDNYNSTEILVKKNKKSSLTIDCFYKDRWKYMKLYNCNIKCTPQQYYNEISQEIEYWKKQSMFKKSFEFKWLKCCNDRLKWLSNQKNNIVITILKHLKDYRVLTFCNSIEQTELLGKYCINSKNKDAMKHLTMFNEGKIKHITACDMVNEGVNLTNCKIGLFAAINSSEILIKQKNGRVLRHKEPVIVIPYYKNTREEELVVKMLENYNKDLVKAINNINDLKL